MIEGLPATSSIVPTPARPVPEPRQHRRLAERRARKKEARVFLLRDENRFRLDPAFVARYVDKQPAWGFGILSRITYERTYARPVSKALLKEQAMAYRGMDALAAHEYAKKSKQTHEQYWQTVLRVVEGVSSILKQQVRDTGQAWSDDEEQHHAQEMFTRMWLFKFTPPGRGLWFMGTEAMELKGSAALNNCGMVSTENISFNFAEPFCTLMDYSMLGVGMGFDLRGAGQATIVTPALGLDTHTVADSREGWVECLRLVLEAFVGRGSLPRGWDFSKVRKEGAPLKTFGGTASGPKPLEQLLTTITALLYSVVGSPISGKIITSIMNIIGRCVVAGNVRRSSEIALGNPDDEDFISLKDPTELNALRARLADIERALPEWSAIATKVVKLRAKRAAKQLSVLDAEYGVVQRQIDKLEKRQKRVAEKDPAWREVTAQIDAHPLMSYLWASNNTAFCPTGYDYDKLADMTVKNGEPGYAWLDVIRAYGRLVDPPNWKDRNAKGFNPCQPASAPVLTPQGIRSFGDIGVGSIIWSGQRWTQVIKKVATGVKPVFKYRTTAGSFVGTAEHRVVANGVKLEVGQADSIDVAVGPVCTNDEAVDPQDIVDGLMLGDGMWHAASKRNFLIQGEKDGAYDDSEVAALLGDRVVWKHEAETTRLLRPAKTTLSEPLPLTYERTIPSRFLQADSTQVRGFLRGLYSANGSIAGGRVTLKAASRDVVDGVQQMLSALGIGSYITTNLAHDVEFENGTYLCRESYDLNISAQMYRQHFQRLIGFIQPDKTARLVATFKEPSLYNNGKGPKSNFDIVFVEPLGNMPVFDITVEADEHTYWSGGLLVSNCGEQTLHDMELCCLVETYPTKHETLEDFLMTLKYAYRYAKAVTLVPTHNKRTNAVMVRNRRIGTSMAGVIEMYSKLGLQECIRWWDTGYREIRKWDDEYSGWLGVHASIKSTSIKPGGTTPLLAGVEGGMKAPTARYYMRTIRFDYRSPLVKQLADAGYRVEKDRTTPRTMVVYFPCETKPGVHTAEELSLWEQAAIFTALQRYWADNMVSATLTFQPDEAKTLSRLLKCYEGQWKCVSFLPLSNHGFLQAPYIPCTREQYEEVSSKIQPLAEITVEHDSEDKWCSGGVCELPVPN